MFVLIGLSAALQAQNEVDALRYSRLGFFGTARYMGTAGAFGALGADFSTLSVNPAGLGLYQSSEFVLTPSLLSSSTNSAYQGNSREDVRYSFNIPNVGYVFSEKTGSETWKYFQFGFGLNKQASFNGRSFAEGINPHNSILDAFAAEAFNRYPNDLNSFGAGLAWDTYLLVDTVTMGGKLNYTTAVPGGGVNQSKSTVTRGGINEMVFSFAGNYTDKLFFGATLGVPFLSYDEESTYSETDAQDTIFDFSAMTMWDELHTSGTGVNLKLGMIYRPVEWVRIGAAVHTPTFYALHDRYSREMESWFDNGDNYNEGPRTGEYDYRLETPTRVIGSLAFVISKYGLISADYEFVDYSSARLRSIDTDYNFFDENDAITEKYTSASNIRVGGELRLSPLLLRAGYAMYGSPYAQNINDGSSKSVTFGIGIREKGFYWDLAYVRTTMDEDYYLYDPALVNAVEQTRIGNNVVMSLGFRF